MAFGQLSLKGHALRLLAMREYSRRELEQKLAAREPDPDELQQALDDLQGKGFLDEQRVVESLLHRRAPRLGVGRIRQELQAKGIDPERVAVAVASLNATEYERARDTWRRKFGTLPQDAQQRAKQARFLASRGFGGEVVRRVLNTPDDE